MKKRIEFLQQFNDNAIHRINWIENKINKNTETGCWELDYSSDRQGYPRPSIQGVRWRFSRFMYTMYVGDIPEGLIVRHTCDNVKCVNPKHLVLGTDQNNSDDMKSRGRGLVSLTLSDKDEIVKLFKKGMPVGEIGKKFNVEYPTITYHLKQMGEYKNTKTKIPKESYQAIFERYMGGVDKKVLADMFGVGVHSINRILRIQRDKNKI